MSLFAEDEDDDDRESAIDLAKALLKAIRRDDATALAASFSRLAAHCRKAEDSDDESDDDDASDDSGDDDEYMMGE